MSVIQTIPVTNRPVNNLMLDVVPAMAALVLRRARRDGQPEPSIVIHQDEVQQLIDALTAVQQMSATAVTAGPTGEKDSVGP
ncbi:MAG: hypothetical protein KKA73_24535 [Chloroflexi bacterium]|nr:hypothetical protein [Chloroflexota bacterium]MBU1750862.1 hypothetical protein [Chloroflexota bacterium]